MLPGIDSLANPAASIFLLPAQQPGRALPRGRELLEVDAAFASGIAVKSLDDLVRGKPVWAGCSRSRQALKCAATAVRLMGRNEDENALRDAVLLTAAGDDPGPAGSEARFWPSKGLLPENPAFPRKAWPNWPIC